MRKGFSLIEVAVVIIVMGIVITLTLYAKDMRYVAKLKKETVNIRKIEAAVALWPYVVRTDDDSGNAMHVNIRRGWLVDAGLIDEVVFKSVIGNFSYDIMTTSQSRGTQKGYIWQKQEADKIRQTDIIIYTALNDLPLIPARLICELESSLDDKAIEGGKGLIFGEQKEMSSSHILAKWYANAGDDTVYKECHLVRGAPTSGYGLSVYP